MEKEKKQADAFKAAWRTEKAARRRGNGKHTPMREYSWGETTYKPMPRAKAIKEAGSRAFEKTLKRLRKQSPPDQISIAASRSAVLRAAHLSHGTKNVGLVDGWLDRLTRDVLINGDALRAIVSSIEETDHKLRIVVSGEWLEAPYGRVPLPLPVRSAHATALYLFLLGIDTRHSNKEASRFATLCERIGIDRDRDVFSIRRAFNRALRIVNEHIRKLDREALAEHGVIIPLAYEVAHEGEMIRLREVVDSSDDTRYVEPRRKPKRVRLKDDVVLATLTDIELLNRERQGDVSAKEEMSRRIRERYRTQPHSNATDAHAEP